MSNYAACHDISSIFVRSETSLCDADMSCFIIGVGFEHVAENPAGSLPTNRQLGIFVFYLVDTYVYIHFSFCNNLYNESAGRQQDEFSQNGHADQAK